MVDRVKVMDIVSDVGVKMVIVVDSVTRKNVISSFPFINNRFEMSPVYFMNNSSNSLIHFNYFP